MIRGFPDEVSLSISILKLFHQLSDNHFKSFIEKNFNPSLSHQTNYQMLFEHPTALNLQIPPAPGESRRNLVVDYLKTSSRIRNPYFKTFIDILNSPEEEDLINYISNAEPFFPKVLGLISGSTVEARARSIAGKLQKTKTISTLARLEGGKDLYSVTEESELNHLKSVLRLALIPCTSETKWDLSKYSVDHAIELRNIGWKKKVEGVDGVPPFEFIVIEASSHLSSCSDLWELNKGYISAKISTEMSVEEIKNPFIQGPFTPYRGSKTRQKVLSYGEKVSIQADPLLKKPLKLYSLKGWVVPSKGNLSSLIDGLLRSRTDIDPAILSAGEEEYPGSQQHRLESDRVENGGSVSCLPNYGSKIVFDTFSLSSYSKGSKNVNLMFQ